MAVAGAAPAESVQRWPANLVVAAAGARPDKTPSLEPSRVETVPGGCAGVLAHLALRWVV